MWEKKNLRKWIEKYFVGTTWVCLIVFHTFAFLTSCNEVYGDQKQVSLKVEYVICYYHNKYFNSYYLPNIIIGTKKHSVKSNEEKIIHHLELKSYYGVAKNKQLNTIIIC